MAYILIVAVTLVCAIEALLAERLLVSALWLAGCSAMVALLLYMLGAPEVAVIELSVGAGLVTVLFVFAINIAGDEPQLSNRPIIPMPIATGIIVVALIALGLFSLPNLNIPFLSPADNTFFSVIWEDRSLDLLLQIVLIFAGVLGILGLLGSGKKDLNKEQDQ
jgi:uncharacterized MnhB-related membrane protein